MPELQPFPPLSLSSIYSLACLFPINVTGSQSPTVPSPSISVSNLPRVPLFFWVISLSFFFFYLLLNLSGDSKASGSPHLSRLDEKAATLEAADLKNMGLAIDLLLLEEPPPPPLPEYLTLDSENGKNPLRRKKGEAFIPL